MATINFKRGDTFSLSCVYKVDDVATSVAPMTITSQLRTSGGDLVQQLTATKTAGTGTFTLVATATQTALWDLALLKCDIQIVENDIVRSSSTFYVKVIEDVTR